MGYKIKSKYPLFLRDIGKGCDSVSGYPVVTVEDNFNIEAKPNTFYNIKNNADSEVNINFKSEEYYVTGKNKYIMFTWDNIDPDSTIAIASYIGGIVVEDSSMEGYKYRIDIDASALGANVVSVYLDKNIEDGVNIKAYANILGTEEIAELTNIHIINKDIDYLYYINSESVTYNIPLITLEEVENDSDFKYKYKQHSLLNAMESVEYLYTNEPIDIATSIFVLYEDNYQELIIVNKILNKDIKPSNIANEFVFNIKSPTNIIFNEEIKWNNDNAPDLTKTGIYTISILDGVGCYTFVNA